MNFMYKERELLIILGLIPFIALTDSALNGLTIGLLLLTTIFLSNLIFSFIEGHLMEPERTIVLLIISATIVTLLKGFLSHSIPALHNNLGIFIPLLGINSFIVYNLKKIDSKYSRIRYGFFLMKQYLLAILLLFIIGILREIFGKGMVLNKSLLNADIESTFILFFNTPVGGFIITGIVVAFYGLIRKKNE